MKEEVLIIEAKGADKFKIALEDVLNSDKNCEMGGFSTCVDQDGNMIYSQIVICYVE